MRNRFKKRRTLNSDMLLQITSMADIFTILLVFLLKSFSTGASNITPSSSMILPEVLKANEIVDTLKLEISAEAIVVDDKSIVSLKSFQFLPTDLESNGTPHLLNKALTQQRKKNMLQKFPKMLILADQNTPFATLKRVLASASETGFVDYKLVVVENE